MINLLLVCTGESLPRLVFEELFKLLGGFFVCDKPVLEKHKQKLCNCSAFHGLKVKSENTTVSTHNSLKTVTVDQETTRVQRGHL